MCRQGLMLGIGAARNSLFLMLLLLGQLTTSAQVIFQNTLGNPNCYEEAYGILPVADHSGYIVSAAYNCVGGAADWKGKLIRLNNDGDTIWTRSDLAANGFLRKSTDGNYLYIGGNHAGLAYDTIVLTKANEYGDTLWSRHLFFAQCNNLAYRLD